MAASLTFTTLLSVVPLITIALTLFSAFPVFSEFSTPIKEFILMNLVPETGGRIITGYMAQFTENASRLTAIGLVFLAVTSMLLMLTIDNAFNMIWRVSRPRSLLQRVLVYWAVITLAPLLIGASLSLTSWLVGFSAEYAQRIPKMSMDAIKLIPLLLTTAAFTLLFRVVPNRFVPMRHAILGGLIAAVAFESMNRAFAFYISHFPPTSWCTARLPACRSFLCGCIFPGSRCCSARSSPPRCRTGAARTPCGWIRRPSCITR